MSEPIEEIADNSLSTDAFLVVCAGFLDAAGAPAEAERLRRVAEEMLLSPAERRQRRRDRRDEAIRQAAALVEAESMTGTARAVEIALARYLCAAWPAQRDAGSPPADAPSLRRALWKIATWGDGEPLAWRQIIRVLEAKSET
jgi:hypothetical protein